MKLPSTNDDRGESLIELLVAMAIMATAVVALVGAIATSIRMSDLHRRQTVAGSYVKAFAESLKSKVAERPSRYTECGGGADPATIYESFYLIPPAEAANYDREAVVTYWNNASGRFESTCPGNDYGVQLVSLRVFGLDNTRATVSEKLDITLRKPCRAANTTPLMDPPASPQEDLACS
jgi:type II secretory pathway pseudopilin PulG